MRYILSLSSCLTILASGLISTAAAQVPVSGYASNYIKQLQVQNSATQFSTRRIQGQNVLRSVPRVGVAGVNMRDFGSGIGNMTAQRKPFSNVQQGPSVSPYLALSNPFSTASDYYNIVRPLQEQRRQNDRMAQQQYLQERRLNQIAAQGPYSVQGDEDKTPTGHPVTRMYFANFNQTGNYFPPPTPPKQ